MSHVMKNRCKTLIVLLFVLCFACPMTFAQEEAKNTSSVYPVAILPFVERQKKNDETGKVVSDIMFATLVTDPSILLVDREDLDKVLEEQGINISGVVDSNSAVKVGHVVGAKILVTGSVLKAGSTQYLVAKVIGIRLKSPFGGLHDIVVLDGGDFTKITWPEGLPVSVESDINSSHTQTHFRGNWTLYFYVPKGTKQIGGWASRVANWAPRTSGKLLDPEGNARYDFSEHEEGWFCVDVPENMDGKVWKFQDNNGQRLLMTVPPYLARSAQELLLPEEVVEKDGM